jgi:hypothetical protein|tara:strand:- start:472 stop:687 length:216 start_codon:yes stop_codon:yes gene_type:complete
MAFPSNVLIPCKLTDEMKRTRFSEDQIIGGLEVSEARRLRALESENAKLKRLLADSMLDQAALKDLLAKGF